MKHLTGMLLFVLLLKVSHAANPNKTHHPIRADMLAMMRSGINPHIKTIPLEDLSERRDAGHSPSYLAPADQQLGISQSSVVMTQREDALKEIAYFIVDTVVQILQTIRRWF